MHESINQSINQSSSRVVVRTCSSRVMSGEYCVFCSSLNILYGCFDHVHVHVHARTHATATAHATRRVSHPRSLARLLDRSIDHSITRSIDRSIARPSRHPPRPGPNDVRSIDARGNIRTFGHVESAPRTSTIARRVYSINRYYVQMSKSDVLLKSYIV